MANVTNLIGLAQQYLGTPYKWGGASPQTGFDCSGFVQWLYGQQGVKLPRTTYQQVNSGSPVSKAGLKPGDILFFEPSAQGPGHEGLYIGNGQFIEAPHTGADVRVSSLAGRTDYVTARRVVPPGTPGLNAVATGVVKQLSVKQQFISQAYQDAVKAGIDPQNFLRQINQESGFNPTARSGAGAVGIAQIVPHYHPGVDATNPTASLQWAANYMAGLVHKYGGSYAKALSVYNSGNPTAYLDPNFAKGQTYNYVKSILGGAPVPVPQGVGSTVQPGSPVPAGGLTAAHNAAQNAAALKLLSGLLSSTAKVPVVNPGFAPLTLPAPATTPAALPTLNLAFQGNYGNPLG